jgi:salicylate hydroxylase
VVGAGICGLTAALVLARLGHRITLVERRTGFSEVGAGLQLSPNASRILLGLGLGSALGRVASEPDRVIVRSLTSGATVGEIALGGFMRDRFEAPYWVVHRADLQQILLDAVRSETRVRLLIGRTAESLSETAASAALSVASDSGNREVLEADGVIGADGVWSTLRRHCGAAPAAYRGYVAWRATLDRARAPAELARNETGLWLGRSGHVVHYPIQAGRLINVVAIERRSDPVEGWSASGRKISLLRRFNGAAPDLRELLAVPEEWQLWSLFDAPVGRLAKGRLALLGDAAHPVLPFLAQGAALAIEDAAMLGSLIRDGSDLEGAFRRYETERRDRAIRVQREARRNGRLYHLPGPFALARNMVMARLGPEGMADRYAWLYGHRGTL